MFLEHEQNITERYFLFSQGSNNGGINEFVSRYICLQPHFSVNIKDKNKIINNYRVPHTHISNRKRGPSQHITQIQRNPMVRILVTVAQVN